MESKIISQKKNPLLKREEFVLEIVSESNPTKEQIVETVGKANELTVVKKISGNYGQAKFHTDVVVYDSVEAKDAVEIVPQKVRKKLEEDKKKAEEEKKKAEEAAEAEKKKAEEEKAAEEKPVETVEENKSEEKSE